MTCGPPSDSKIPMKSDAKENDGKEKPAADFSVRARRLLRWCRYAPDLPDGSNVFLIVNGMPKIRRNGFGWMKRMFAIIPLCP